MRNANGPDIAAVYQLPTQVAHTVTGHDRKLDDLAAGLASLREAVTNYHSTVLDHGILISELDERVRCIERHLKLEPRWRSKQPSPSDQPSIAQAGVTAPPDDQVVMHSHPQRGGRLDDVLCYSDIRIRGCWIARGMVVHQNQSRRPKFERASDHLAGINRRMVDCPAL